MSVLLDSFVCIFSALLSMFGSTGRNLCYLWTVLLSVPGGLAVAIGQNSCRHIASEKSANFHGKLPWPTTPPERNNRPCFRSHICKGMAVGKRAAGKRASPLPGQSTGTRFSRYWRMCFPPMNLLMCGLHCLSIGIQFSCSADSCVSSVGQIPLLTRL